MSEFYSPFHRVIALHESPELEWESISKQVPLLPRGWFELSRLTFEDRKEFLGDFWLSKLNQTTHLSEEIENRIREFFADLEEVGIFLTQTTPGQMFEVHMHYGLKQEKGYFHADPPASDETIFAVQRQFGTLLLPADYLAFLQIHDGFNRYVDTGVLKSKELARVYQRLQHSLSDEFLTQSDGELINPTSLIPFYESTESHFYQCFYADWYPNQEMGNVTFSSYDLSISDFSDPQFCNENCAFHTFLDWLIFYLEHTYA